MVCPRRNRPYSSSRMTLGAAAYLLTAVCFALLAFLRDGPFGWLTLVGAAGVLWLGGTLAPPPSGVVPTRPSTWLNLAAPIDELPCTYGEVRRSVVCATRSVSTQRSRTLPDSKPSPLEVVQSTPSGSRRDGRIAVHCCSVTPPPPNVSNE